MYHASLAAGLAAKDMLTPHAAPALCETTVRMAAEQAAAAAVQAAEADSAMDEAGTMVDAAAPGADAPSTKLNAEAARRFVTHALAAPVPS